MPLGKISRFAVDGFGYLDSEESWPIPVEIRLGSLVSGRGQALFAALPGQRRASLGVGNNGSRDESGGANNLSDLSRSVLFHIKLD